MGNTATSLHLLTPPSGVRGFDRHLKVAYEALGYAARPAGAEAQKRVAVTGGGDANAFLSIYDSDNALIDSGELKQLAVALSGRLKTAAVVTSIYDSDYFEFIVFNKGKQVDAVVSDPDQHEGSLKMLKAGRRTVFWKEMFFVPAAQRTVMTSATPIGTASMNLIMERERAFDAVMARVGKIEGAFAEDGLTACCEAAGLDVGHALARDAKEAGEDADSALVLSFEKLASATQDAAGAAPGIGPGEIKLAPYLSDDFPELRYFPAAWPFVPGAPVRVDWAMVSSGAGFSGLKLRFAFSGTPENLSGKLVVKALPFYNGQVTSGNAIASFEQSAPAMSDGAWTFDAAPIVIPHLNPEARNRIIMIIALEIAGSVDITINPAVAPSAAATEPLVLPPVRLKAERPSWIPRVAQDAWATKGDAIMRLNQPSVFSAVAMLDDNATQLATVRQYAEQWLGSLGVADGAELAVATQKHMSAGFRVAKAEKSLPLNGAPAHSLWPKLFDLKSDYHTVMLQLMPAGRSYPIAGFTWQATLRYGGLRDEAQSLAHLRNTVAPYVDASAHPVENDGGSAASIAVWMLNDPAIFEALGTTPEQLTEMFEGWMAGKAPIQAWITRSAWFPEFDLYEQFNQTIYEKASTIDWFRSGLNGMLTRRAWACRRLRFVGSPMWLGKELRSQVDMERLADVAELSAAGDATRVRLRDGRSLRDLEAALAPILPVQ